jgi:hypothetical protein
MGRVKWRPANHESKEEKLEARNWKLETSFVFFLSVWAPQWRR